MCEELKEKEYNCFECGGYDKQCPTYISYYGQGKCLYRKTAEMDLEKLKVGNPNTTLTDMLKKYLEENKESGRHLV